MNKIELKEFVNAHNLIKPFINKTPLDLFKNNVYLKESLFKKVVLLNGVVYYIRVCVFLKN